MLNGRLSRDRIHECRPIIHNWRALCNWPAGVPDLVDVFYQWIATVRGWPSTFSLLFCTPRTAADDHFQTGSDRCQRSSVCPSVGNVWNRLAVWRTVGIHRKPRPTHRQLLPNGTSSCEPPLRLMVENDWTNLTWLNCVTFETRLLDYFTDSDCPGFSRSISTVFNRFGRKPDVMFKGGSRCGGRLLLIICDCRRVVSCRRVVGVLAVVHTQDHCP